jgi:hypothetical protein
MYLTIYSSFATSVLILLTRVVCAQNSKAIPCALGSGPNNGCSYCEEEKAVEVTSWDAATLSSNFDLPQASVQGGGGYNVWWVSNTVLPSELKALS